MKITYQWVKQYVEQAGNQIYVTGKGGVFVLFPGVKNGRLNITRYWDKLQRECRLEIFEEQKNLTVFRCLPEDDVEKEV